MRTCFAFLFFISTISGCGKSAPTDPPASSSSQANTSESAQATSPTTLTPVETKRVDASGFALGEYLPPLDGGRLEIAPPAEWNPLPRDSKYVVRFFKKSRNSLPRINVVVEERNVGGIEKSTLENLHDVTAVLTEELKENGTSLLEPPIPMQIGTSPCVRYVSNVKLKIGAGTIQVERQTVALLHAGRLYKINLLVMSGRLGESRDEAYAVCAGLRFTD